MSTIVRRSVALAASPDRVWQLICQPATFRYVTRGLFGFQSAIPDTNWLPGATVEGRLWLAHLLPLWRHRITIVHVDPTARRIETAEQGGLLRSWRHVLHVEPATAGGSIYTDEITLDAGNLTSLSRPIVRSIFGYRQRRLKKLTQASPT